MTINLQLPELPFTRDAFEPMISAETFDYHYGKHHATYVQNLAELIKDTSLATASLEQIIQHADQQKNTALFNNSAQHWNHSFFWHCLSPVGGSEPKGLIAEFIIRDFGSFALFKEQFSSTSIKLFGAGWVWLVQNEFGRLEILALKDAQTPLTQRKKAILTLDVWEHAYYIDHRNARPKFVESYWEIVNWDFANHNLITSL